jgi:hypothetical protein
MPREGIDRLLLMRSQWKASEYERCVKAARGVRIGRQPSAGEYDRVGRRSDPWQYYSRRKRHAPIDSWPGGSGKFVKRRADCPVDIALPNEKVVESRQNSDVHFWRKADSGAVKALSFEKYPNEEAGTRLTKSTRETLKTNDGRLSAVIMRRCLGILHRGSRRASAIFGKPPAGDIRVECADSASG